MPAECRDQSSYAYCRNWNWVVGNSEWTTPHSYPQPQLLSPMKTLYTVSLLVRTTNWRHVTISEGLLTCGVHCHCFLFCKYDCEVFSHEPIPFNPVRIRPERHSQNVEAGPEVRLAGMPGIAECSNHNIIIQISVEHNDIILGTILRRRHIKVTKYDLYVRSLFCDDFP